jgi:superfamily II DNA or RNA helicase
MRKLREKTGIKHQIIAVACSVDHARQVRSIYSELGLKAAEIYSEMEDEAKEQVFSDLASGRLDCIVQVQMLGEGFDHPQLTVAAIFRPFRSLSPYIQFVGRIMRIIHEGEPGHSDNHGFVVSHIGLNNDARWDEFKELDVDDQAIIRRWLHDSEDETVTEERNGGGRSRRFDLGMDVMDEVVSHFIEGSFLDPDDDRILDQLLSQRIGSGLTLGDIIPREEFRAKLKEKIEDIRAQQPQQLVAQPQKMRQEGRKRLNERAKAVANRVLSDLGLSRAGVDVLKTGLARGNNFAALVILLNKEVNSRLGIPSGSRADLSREQVEQAFSELDSIGDTVRETLRKRVGGQDAQG